MFPSIKKFTIPEGTIMQHYLDLFGRLPKIRTERLILRAARMSDADDMYEYCRDPKVARYVLWDAHTSIHQTRNYIRFLIRQYKDAAPATFVIEYAETGKVIGTIGFLWVQPDNRSAEVGYSLNREYWNKGIMTEALAAILDFAFTKLNMNRVEAEHDVNNPASGKVMAKVGMSYEGTLRQRIFNKGSFADVALYSMLKEEYRK